MRLVHNNKEWSTVEDQILVAGVMKYGHNRWAKVSSLLSRAPAQCRRRYEHSICSSIETWSREELVRLLQLAKTFPSQYELIGRMLGRPSAQCYAMHSKACLGLVIQEDLKAEYYPSNSLAGYNEEERFALEFARARLMNTRTRKDIKKLKGGKNRL